MALAQGVSARVAYKFYASGDMDPAILANTATAPGATGGFTLRRVGATLSLAKDSFQSAEVRTDYQIVDFRHGSMRAEGAINGELSCGTYTDLFEAVHRDTRQAAISSSQAVLTSVAFDLPTSTAIFAGGDPVAVGFRVGMIIRFTGMTDTTLDNRNYLITGFSGASNRTMKIWPAIATTAADTTFTMASIGKTTIVPNTGHVKRLAGVEVFHSDTNTSRLYTECRFSSYRIQMPTSGMTTIEFGVMGRTQYSPASGPYFTAPAAPTNTGIVSALDGVLLINGTVVGLVTAADLAMDLSPSPAAVIGQNYAAEVFQGRETLTGSITAFLDQTSTLMDAYVNETEISLLLFMRTSTVASASAMAIFVPRIKLSSGSVNLTGEQGQSVTYNIQGLKYVGTTPGITQTTIQIADTDAA